MKINNEYRKSNIYCTVEISTSYYLSHIYGDVYPMRLAWDLSRQLHIPAYIVFSIVMDLVEQGKFAMLNHKIHGEYKCNSDTNIPKFVSPYAKSIFEEQSFEHHDRGRWEFFRKLIPYYIECLRLEGGASVQARLDTLGTRFIFLDDAGCWYPQGNMPWKKILPFDTISETIRELWRNSETTRLVLGYPVAVVQSKKNEIWVRPVFCYILDHRLTSSGLEVQVRMSKPSVNTIWLDHTFSDAVAKRNFLETCGMYDSVVDDEENFTARYMHRKGNLAPDFLQLAQVLSAGKKNIVQELLDPRKLSTRPLDASCKNGLYNRAVVLANRSSKYTQRLVAELVTISRAPDEVLDRTALRHIFAEGTPPTEKVHAASGAVGVSHPLTGTQRRAVASLLENVLTTIQGPPGTGKSQVVSEAVYNARLRGQSVLISSYNHKAIDAVMERQEPLDNAVPLITRCNSKEDPSLSFGMRKAIRSMLSMSEGSTPDVHIRDIFCQLLAKCGKYSTDIDEEEKCYRSLDTLYDFLDIHIKKNTVSYNFSDTHIKYLQLYKKALQITKKYSKENIYTCFLKNLKIKEALCIFHALIIMSISMKKIPEYLKKNGLIEDFSRDCENIVYQLKLREQILTLRKQIQSMPSLKKLYSKLAHLERVVRKQLPHVRHDEAISRTTLSPSVDRVQLKALEQSLAIRRNPLVASELATVLDKELPDRLSVVFQNFPCWAVSSLSIGRFIPLVPGLFDLVLVDEASQSNIPSAIPLLFRAKRAGIIGDPCQLRFVSRVTSEVETPLLNDLHMNSMADLRFTFANNSLYDLASSSNSTTSFLLDCTFRSTGDIAEYSNRLFYNGKLTVGTDEDRLRRPEGAQGSIEWCPVEGTIYRTSGQGSCWCPEEIERVVELVRDLLVTRHFNGSLGIATPFREHARRMEDSLQVSGIDHTLLEHAGVHVNTAHGFQGDERDVIIFSLCCGKELSSGALHFLRENPNIFNVAVSRARAMLYIIGNINWARQCGIRHIEFLASPSLGTPGYSRKSKWYPYESPYEKLLAEALIDVGLNPIPQAKVGYRRLDLALRDTEFPDCKLDIEVDGSCHRDEHGLRESDDLWRTLELNEAGWKVVRFWTYELRENLSHCVKRVQNIWNKMHEYHEKGAKQ